MTTPAENPASPDDATTAYRSVCTAIERASLAHQLARVLGQLHSVPDMAKHLELTDEESVWLRDHPGDLLSPGQPPRLGLAARAKQDNDRGPSVAGIVPAPAAS